MPENVSFSPKNWAMILMSNSTNVFAPCRQNLSPRHSNMQQTCYWSTIPHLVCLWPKCREAKVSCYQNLVNSWHRNGNRMHPPCTSIRSSIHKHWPRIPTLTKLTTMLAATIEVAFECAIAIREMQKSRSKFNPAADDIDKTRHRQCCWPDKPILQLMLQFACCTILSKKIERVSSIKNKTCAKIRKPFTIQFLCERSGTMNARSGHPESKQGPYDCCFKLQSDALPTEL